MNSSVPNLFNALFEFHPRDGHTPKENFLSEAFAHVLMTCEEARNAWLTRALGENVKSQQFELETRLTERDEDGVAIFPDMKISGLSEGGRRFSLYSEHKWNSPCDSDQIKKYVRAIRKNGDQCCLVFIGATYLQKTAAEASDSGMKGKAFLWSDVFRSLDSVPNKSNILTQFLDFMKAQGLSPGQPIDSHTMVGFIKAKNFLAILGHFANRLNDEFLWNVLPKRYLSAESRGVTNRWGRIAIEFTTPDWKPTITIGFLHDESDHGVKFVAPQNGIDLLLRIETAPNEQQNIHLALPELERKKSALNVCSGSVLIHNDRGNGSLHTLLIVRDCLANVIGPAVSQQEQLEKIHATFTRWCQIIFDDGAIEEAFKRAGLDSGM